MFQCFCSFSKGLYRIFPLRARYLYRKDNRRLRLRYTVVPSLFVLGLLGFYAPSFVTVSDMPSLFEKTELTAALPIQKKEKNQNVEVAAASEDEGLRYPDTLDLFRDETGQIRRSDTSRKAAALVQSYAMQFREAVSKSVERTIEIGKGDTLAGVLQKAG